MTRDELERKIGHHVAFAMTGNRMPDMGGDTRNRLCPMQRRDCDHAVEAIIDHPRIARALTLLDRIGEHAADALIAGTAAVVPVLCDFDVALKAAEADAIHQTMHGEQIDMQTLYGLFLRGRLDRGGA